MRGWGWGNDLKKSNNSDKNTIKHNTQPLPDWCWQEVADQGGCFWSSGYSSDSAIPGGQWENTTSSGG